MCCTRQCIAYDVEDSPSEKSTHCSIKKIILLRLKSRGYIHHNFWTHHWCVNDLFEIIDILKAISVNLKTLMWQVFYVRSLLSHIAAKKNWVFGKCVSLQSYCHTNIVMATICKWIVQGNFRTRTSYIIQYYMLFKAQLFNDLYVCNVFC